MVLAVGTAYAADAEFVSLAQGTSITGSPMDLSYAGTFNIDVGPPFDGPLTEAYCVDISHHIAIGDVRPASDAGVSLPGRLHSQRLLSQCGSPLAPTSSRGRRHSGGDLVFTDGFRSSADLPTSRPAPKPSSPTRMEATASRCPIVPQSMTVTPASATNYLPADVNSTTSSRP
mgnify:CR=1 FL=1